MTKEIISLLNLEKKACLCEMFSLVNFKTLKDHPINPNFNGQNTKQKPF